MDSLANKLNEGRELFLFCSHYRSAEISREARDELNKLEFIQCTTRAEHNQLSPGENGRSEDDKTTADSMSPRNRFAQEQGSEKHGEDNAQFINGSDL